MSWNRDNRKTAGLRTETNPRLRPVATRRPATRGFSMPELIVAMVVLLALMAAVGQTVVILAGQQRAVEQQHAALHEISNLMDRVFSLPYDQITAESVQSLPLSETCRNHLRDSVFAAEVADADEGPRGKRIRLELSWRSRTGSQMRNVELVAWRFEAVVEESE